MEPRNITGRQGMYKHAVLVIFSLLPFGMSAIASLAVWELSSRFDPVPRLGIAVITWVLAFVVGTRAFWKIAEGLAPR